jgi:radical SAM superfamily enzyme with C-terminal helix-hairpin-helix motif
LNWAASGAKAVSFLEDIQSYSILKKEQIRLCIEWHYGRSILTRLANGRICAKTTEEINRDISYSNRVRALKDTPLGVPYEPYKGDTSSRGCVITQESQCLFCTESWLRWQS